MRENTGPSSGICNLGCDSGHSHYSHTCSDGMLANLGSKLKKVALIELDLAFAYVIESEDCYNSNILTGPYVSLLWAVISIG